MRKQINSFKKRILNESNSRKKSQEIIQSSLDNITANNSTLNMSNVLTGTLGTGRYIVSAAGHATGSGVLKAVGNAGGLFGKFLPFFSVAVDVVTQTNHNNVVFDYEKKLSLLSLTDDARKNLVILQQLAFDQYNSGILIRFDSFTRNSHG